MVNKMNNYSINKEQLSKQGKAEILNGFERALIWQDENLDDYSGLHLTYSAQEKCEQTVNIFVSLVMFSDIAMAEMFNHGLSKCGHDLALQMLGHGVGFWEQKETNKLDRIVNIMLDDKLIKPFHLYHDASEKKLDWDCV